MPPRQIRLIHLELRTVGLYDVDTISWDKVWTISHIWDRGEKREETVIPLSGVSWKSTSFSSENRFNVMFEKTLQIVRPHGAEYLWIDAACIHQEKEDEQKEQVPFMGTIYSKSAGCVAFGTLTPDNRFVPIASTCDDGRKAWVCSWFERVWTFQELQLPKVLFFVSGARVLSRDEVYLSVLMMSPFLTSPHPLPKSKPNDPTISIQDVLNTLSPLSRTNTQRSLMQTSKRGCSGRYINDKVYGILGVLAQPFTKLKVDYGITLEQAVLNLMMLMPSKDVLDTLTFNTVPLADGVHDSIHWSGMIMLNGPTEHPSYETDIHHPTDALVVAAGEAPCTTLIHNAPLWKVVITKPEGTHGESANTDVRAWPSIVSLSRYAGLTDDFSKVGRSAEYADAVGRAERSLAANWKLLQPSLEKAGIGEGGEELLSILHDPPSNASDRPGGIPPNRLGDVSLFGQEVTVLVCRSKADRSFHYGIVVTLNEDGATWHKVCTAAFSDSCVVDSSRTHLESLVVIGK